MDHSTHVHLSESELTDAVLSGAPIYGPDDASIGTVAAVHGEGLSAHAVIDVGGFIGIGTKPVAVAVGDLSFMRDAEGNVHGYTSWTKEQMNDLPVHEYETELEDETDIEDEVYPPLSLGRTVL